jgi:glutathione S-transferase
VDAEKELELVKVSVWDGHHLLPGFTQKQPFGKIPFFEDSDITIFESRAIARYLAEKYEGQGTNLLGKTAKERAAVHQWSETEAHGFTATGAPLIRELYYAEAQKRPVNEDTLKSVEPPFNKVLDIYEAHLSSQGTKYLAGDQYSLAEVFHTPNVHYVAVRRPEFFATRPCLLAWVKDITTRPSFVKCLQMDWERAPLLE